MSGKRVKKTDREVENILKTMEEAFERFEIVDQNVREYKNAADLKLDKFEEIAKQVKDKEALVKQVPEEETLSGASKQILTRRSLDVKSIGRQIRARRRG